MHATAAVLNAPLTLSRHQQQLSIHYKFSILTHMLCFGVCFLLQAQSTIASTFGYTLELTRSFQDYPGILSSMLFTVSRAMRVCKALPDPDFMFMKVTDALRSVVDHLNAYEDFSGFTMVGSEFDLVDMEEWLNGPRRDENTEIVMRDLMQQLQMAQPGSRLVFAEPFADNRVPPPANLQELLAARGGGVSVVVERVDLTQASPGSPVAMPTGMPMQVPIPVPVQMPLPTGLPFQVAYPSPALGDPRHRVVTTAPPHRVDSVEHMFIPDGGVAQMV